MPERKWTPEQSAAITARGGTLLVSAAAGSGKTAVLVERVIRMVTDPDHPCDTDRLLTVTFTKAAAAEMRARVAARLGEMLASDPCNENLRRQQMLLSKAHIGTIHSFCADLIREYFFELDLSPDFKIADDAELQVIGERALTEVFDELLSEENAGFIALHELIAPRRDDTALRDVVMRLHRFVRAHPFPARWLAEKAALYDAGTPLEETAWGAVARAYAVNALNYATDLLALAIRACETEPEIEAAYAPSLLEARDALLATTVHIETGGWDETARRLARFSFARFGRVKSGVNDALKEQITALRKEAGEIIGRLQALFDASADECADDLAALSPLVHALCEAVRRFDAKLSAMKTEKRTLDFGDLEHYAIRLLIKEEGAGFARTPMADEVAARFDEVLVDEYQDTNEAQDLIFRALSPGGNLFLVGDVKQSIYRFRNAMPEIFLRRRAEASPLSLSGDNEGAGTAPFPARVALDRNFRSGPGLIAWVNFVFRQIMTRELGELDYAGEEELRCGIGDTNEEDSGAALHLLDIAEDGSDARDTLEARHIGSWIREQMDAGVTVCENGIPRPARYRDFCILLRSKGSHAPAYVQELLNQEIPAYTDTASGFLGTPEVSWMLSLLRILDNPVQDVPLLAVLMSPLYGFSPDDVTDIRLALPKQPLYHALRARADGGDPRARAFWDEVARLRRLSAALPTDELIARICEETGYIAMAAAMPGGTVRRDNLRLLMEYARRYESAGYQGLSGFIRFIDRLERTKSDLAPAAALPESADVVRVMSIHASKGLEFPICIVAGCGTAFNRRDLTAPALLHPALGIGLGRREESGRQYTTLPREAIALELERDFLSEEMRILYVAMTRARERLLMVISCKDAAKTLRTVADTLPPAGPPRPFALRKAKGFGDWLLACALRHPDAGELRALCGEREIAVIPDGERLAVRICSPEPPRETPPAAPAVSDKADPALLSSLTERLTWRYPFESLHRVPAKVAASELAQRSAALSGVALARPAFLMGEGLSPTQRGIALHKFMQFADFERAAAAPEHEALRLMADGFLSKEEMEAVDIDRVRAFFESDLYRRMLKSGRVHREMRFNVFVDPAIIDPSVTAAQGEQVVLQGVVDLVFEEMGALILVDYKTDRVNDLSVLAARYAAQLNLYAYAMREVLGMEVRERVLYSFWRSASIGL